MAFRFERLEVWQKACAFTNLVYSTTASFPKEEIFGLTAQLRRAAVSIASSVAEGSDRKSDLDFVRYLRMALSSLNEVVTQLYIALDQKYLSEQNFSTAYEEANRLAAMLNALINSLHSAK